MRRTALALVGIAIALVLLLTIAIAVLLTNAKTASAQETLGWWLTASGSAHCTRDANHVVCSKYNTNGTYLGPVVDFWLPQFCTFAGSASGNNAGAPLRLRFHSPYSSGQGCIGNGQSPFAGWTDGYGHSEGQNYWAPDYVTEAIVTVPFRSTATPAAWGTEVAIH